MKNTLAIFGKNFKLRLIICFIISIILFSTACKKIDVYQKMEFFNNFEWDSIQKPAFNFSIKDTNTYYNVYVVLRHNDEYHYNNLWVGLNTQSPDKSFSDHQIELILSKNNRGWLGTGIDDVYTHYIKVTENPVKLKQGDYCFRIRHIMRENPLPNIFGIGIKLEKTSFNR